MSDDLPESASKKPGWHRVYYALGAFNVISVLVAIGLSHKAMSGFTGSIEVNEVWAQRLGAYSELTLTTSRANGPGNDVFETGDPDQEAANLAVHRTQFAEQYRAAIDELQRNTPVAVHAPLIAKLAEVEQSFAAMNAEAELIFAAFRRGDREAAGRHMASMDRHFSVTSEGLNWVTSEVRRMQQRQFSEQEAEAAWLKNIEYVLAAIVVLIVAAILAYGRKLAMVFARQQALLDAKNSDMRRVLDHVAQGFITITPAGVMYEQRSAVVERWFGRPATGATLQSYLAAHAPAYAAWLDLGLAELRAEIMPTELVLDQLPRRFEAGNSVYEVAYTPIPVGGAIEQLLVVVSDITSQVASEVSQREQAEIVNIFQRLTVDRTGVEEFLLEAGGLVSQVRDESDPVIQKRLVHTLKGNCAIYGLESYATLTQKIENEMADSGDGLSESQRARLIDMWRQAMRKVGGLLGAARRDLIEIERHDLVAATQLSTSPALTEMLESWAREPIARRFERLAMQARDVARKLGKPEPRIEIHGNGIRLDAEGRTAFWAAMVHVVRNAVDHGIEDEAARLQAGKPRMGQIVMAARIDGRALILTVSDDGRGLDWEAVRARARTMGLPCSTAADLAAAIFHDGFTTRADVTEVSGRGVGLAALADVVRELGGRISVESTPGTGTTFTFTFEDHASPRALTAPRSRESSLVPQFS